MNALESLLGGHVAKVGMQLQEALLVEGRAGHASRESACEPLGGTPNSAARKGPSHFFEFCDGLFERKGGYDCVHKNIRGPVLSDQSDRALEW